MVEHNLAKVGVASSNLVSRSRDDRPYDLLWFTTLSKDIKHIYHVLIVAGIAQW